MSMPSGIRIVLVYDPIHGVPMADGLAAEFVSNIVHSKQEHLLYTSSSLVIDYFRLALRKKELTPSDIFLQFEGNQILLAPSGRFASHLPVGFCDYTDNILMELL